MSTDTATASSGFRPSMRDALTACSPRSNDDRQDRCAYPSKPCPNARATKLNGDRHNFCELHRRKANMNQRRWQQRRRRMRHGSGGGSSPSTSLRDEPLSPHGSDEIESARAVMMLQQSPLGGRYSPQPTHAWPHYPPTSEWAPRSHSPQPQAVLRHPYPQHQQYPVSYSRPSLMESPLTHGSPYTYAPRPAQSMIPPLRSLPLPPLLPSVLAPAPTQSPQVVSARVYTC